MAKYKNNRQSTIDNRQSNAFTIVELLVAMSLLIILLGLSGMVFSTTVKAHRAGGASIDVSRNLRAITDQLTTDFRGLQKDAPVFIAFNGIDENGNGEPNSFYDTIHFFADGDFQTTKQYGTPLQTIYGNMARIYYGHANTNTPGAWLLARKSHILTADNDISFAYGEIPKISNGAVLDYIQFFGSFGVSNVHSANYTDENELEFNTITLTNWINALNYLDGGSPDNANHFIDYCMIDASRPQIDLQDMATLHLLLSQGVLQMQIQWAYTNEDLVVPATGLPPVPGFTGIRWWPEIDPNKDGNSADSDFGAAGMNQNQFGIYFTMPGGVNVDIDSNGSNDWFAIQNSGTSGVPFSNTFHPKALKFSFVLRDSNGVFAEGKTFTHIVYINN